MNTLFVAYIAGFTCAALGVFAVGLALIGIYDRNSKLWVSTRRTRQSSFLALKPFLSELLIMRALQTASLKRMYAKLQKDVVRANYPTPARELFGQFLLEGFLAMLVLSLLFLVVFGPVALFISVPAAYAWVMWIRPSLAEADGEKRARAIYRRLPYALDLGVLVLQSGGTLRDAMEIIARNDDPLAQEFRFAMKELDSGATQATALTNMSKRIGIPAVDTIVMAINRGAETGAPMAQTLATQAELFRERRLQEIEKLAVEAPTKMTFPNMLVMSAVLVLVLGPVLIKISASGIF